MRGLGSNRRGSVPYPQAPLSGAAGRGCAGLEGSRTLGTGHLHQIQAPGDGIQAAQREAKAVVELRVPFELTRQEIDDVERGATDSDWSPVKEAGAKSPLPKTAPSSTDTPRRGFRASVKEAAIRD